MKIEFNIKFKPMDRVFHQTKESNQGFIIDVSYSVLNKSVKYLVAFSQNESDWYYEHELSETIVY